MKNAHKRWGLGAALTLAAGSMLAMAAPTAAKAAAPTTNGCPHVRHMTRMDHFAGILTAVSTCSGASDAAIGTPPLLFHGGPVMMTRSTGPLVVTPIFWSPASNPMSQAYKLQLLSYLGNAAEASGQLTNVYSVLNEYYGTNGRIHYNMKIGFPLFDSDPLPASGCTVASTDTSNIYGDGSGYNACIDDNQVTAEIDHVTSTYGLPHNLSHIYVMYLPKHVESCFFAGSTTTAANACTINYQPSAAYCAYHSEDTTNAVYANMPYPIYNSAVGFTCGSEFNFGTVESPNNNPDSDVEISPTSHEISEAITDPDTMTGWYDSSGFEIGDECAYIYGQTQGFPGHLYNQTFNFSFHYLTQEEFSNRDFAITGGGCVQSALDEA